MRRPAHLFLLAAVPLAAFDWSFVGPLPRPVVPPDNPMSEAKVELGRHLFYDKRMSGNGGMSCASCHRQDLAFTDGLARAEGTTGQRHPRGSMSLVNIAYAPRLTWAHPDLASLEEQALVPMLGEDPVELGLKGHEDRFLAQVRGDPVYRRLFSEAFPREPDPFHLGNVTKALAAFQRTIVSARSPYDRYRFERDAGAISEAARRGEILFFSGERAGCFQCHGGWNFSGPVRVQGGPEPDAPFHNTALYDLAGAFAYPPGSRGVAEFTKKPEDSGRLRAPTLRNIAVTAPYMHDGSLKTLEEVIDHYEAGGRARNNERRSPILRSFRLAAEERQDLIEFLKSLTDAELLRDPRWSDPWQASRAIP